MKFKLSNILLIIFLLFSILLAKPKKKLSNIEKLYLVSIKKNAVCDSKKDVVKFLDIGFVGETFLTSLMSNFHLNNEKVAMSQGRFVPGLTNYRKKVIYQPFWVYFKNNFDLKKLDDTSREKIRQQTGIDYEIELNLNTSLWEQRVSGTYVIYFQSKKIDSGAIEAISTYIIKDEDSPYVTKYDEELNDFQNPLDHRGEILKVYAELGESIGKKLRSLFVEEVKPVKKKAPKKKKRQKKSKEKQKFWDVIKPRY